MSKVEDELKLIRAIGNDCYSKGYSKAIADVVAYLRWYGIVKEDQIFVKGLARFIENGDAKDASDE